MGIKGGANREPPVDRLEELALEHVELRDADAADFGVEVVGAECVAEALARDGDGRDDEAVAGEGREGEEGHPRAYLVNVVQREQETRFLLEGQLCARNNAQMAVPLRW